MPGNYYILQNDELYARISPDGAQLLSLNDRRTGEHLLWNGDPAVWREHAPWLFPVIGKLKDDHFIYDGKPYKTPMHGFAKRMRFSNDLVGAGRRVFVLTYNDDTLAVYPWRFRLDIDYTLENRKLTARAVVTNLDEKTMYFSLGAHPGFVCQNGDQLVFGGTSALTYRRLEPGSHLLKKENHILPLNDGRMDLDGSLFREDAVILEKPDVNEIILKKAGGADIRFSYDDVPYFGLWSRHLPDDKLKYICLEPWLGVDDPVDADGFIEHKEGICALRHMQNRTFTISMEVL